MSAKLPHSGGGEPLLVERSAVDAATIPTRVGELTPAGLRAWRDRQGLTQPALAARLGVHEMTLSRWERGEREIPPYLHLALERLAQLA